MTRRRGGTGRGDGTALFFWLLLGVRTAHFGKTTRKPLGGTPAGAVCGVPVCQKDRVGCASFFVERHGSLSWKKVLPFTRLDESECSFYTPIDGRDDGQANLSLLSQYSK